MSKKILCVALLLSSFSYAQIGIGTELPDPSAVLQVSSNTRNQGVLIPEVDLTSLTDTSVIKNGTPAIGLIINNTNTDKAKDLSRGFYYWGVDPQDDSKKLWIKVMGSLDIQNYIKDGQVFSKFTLVNAVEGSKGAGVSIDTKEPGVAELTFTETVSEIKRFNANDLLENVVTKPEAGFTKYEYVDESGAKRYITVSQDVSNDFSKIVEKNKSVIENIVKEISGDVKVIYKNGDIVFEVIDNGTVKEISIVDLITEHTYLASITKNTDVANNKEEVKMSYAFNDGKAGNTTLIYNESLTPLTRFNSIGSEENIIAKPAGNLTNYEYLDEAGNKRYITVSQDVSNDFETIVNQGDNIKFIKEIAKTVKGNDNIYSTTKEEVIGKWDDKDVMRYVVKLTQANAFTSVELSKAIAGLIVDAKLINTATNSVTRGVISKQVNGVKTTLAIGTSGTIIPNNPAGTYYVIVEYVKE